MKFLFNRLLLVIMVLILVTGCAAMQSRWEKAKSADTITAYEEFLMKHPYGDLSDQARARLNQLYEQEDWKVATQRNTILSYEDFLKRYPDGVFVGEASQRLKSLYFQEAQSRDTITAYKEFLMLYPQGKFADEIRERLKKAVAKADFLGSLKKVKIEIEEVYGLIQYGSAVQWGILPGYVTKQNDPTTIESVKKEIYDLMKAELEREGYEITHTGYSAKLIISYQEDSQIEISGWNPFDPRSQPQTREHIFFVLKLVLTNEEYGNILKRSITRLIPGPFSGSGLVFEKAKETLRQSIREIAPFKLE